MSMKNHLLPDILGKKEIREKWSNPQNLAHSLKSKHLSMLQTWMRVSKNNVVADKANKYCYCTMRALHFKYYYQ